MRSIGFATAGALLLAALPAYAEGMIAPDGLKASANSVTVGSVSADKSSYVVVHEADESGAIAGTIIGHAAVKEGDSSSVSIPLGRKMKAGAKLIVMLHEEMDGDTKFGPEDKPVAAGRGPVQQVVTVQ